MALRDPKFQPQMNTVLAERDVPSYRSRYPDRIDLRPNSEDHRILLEYLLELGWSSYNQMRKRFSSWREIDEKMTAFIRLDDAEEKLKAKDDRKPLSMVVPISFATYETLMTYDVATFLRDPIFRYSPNGPEDTQAAIMLEMLINRNATNPLSKVNLSLHTMLGDSKKYGFGAAAATWKKKKGFVTSRTTGSAEKVQKDTILYEGNSLLAFDPYSVLPDLSVPITDIEDMEYFGWVTRQTLKGLLGREELEEEWFNLQYLKNTSLGPSSLWSGGSNKTGRYQRSQMTTNQYFSTAAPVDIMFMYVKLIPKDFNLGPERYPRLWKFAVAGDRVICQAEEVQLNHNRIPVAAIAPTGDGHTILPVSILEVDYPMQKAIDWIWSSHVANVRKMVHNMLVVDPEIINIEDVVDTTWGMLARVRESHWGRGVKDGVQQLNVSDVTRQHPSDVGFMMEISNRISAASDQAMGFQQRRGERVSAREAQDTRQSLLSRLESRAALASMQGLADIGYMFASDVNQFLDRKTYVKVTGQWEEVLRREYGLKLNSAFVTIDPAEIDLAATVQVNDGSMPSGDNAEAWQLLMQEVRINPTLAQSVDSVRLFLHLARLLGARNPEQFLSQVDMQIEPDEEKLDNQVQQGNLVPAEEFVTNGQSEPV